MWLSEMKRTGDDIIAVLSLISDVPHSSHPPITGRFRMISGNPKTVISIAPCRKIPGCGYPFKILCELVGVGIVMLRYAWMPKFHLGMGHINVCQVLVVG